MNQISGAQRTLHSFLLAYHRTGLAKADAAQLPIAASCDLERLIEVDLVELRFVPIAGAQTTDDEPTFIGLDLVVAPDRTETVAEARDGR